MERAGLSVVEHWAVFGAASLALTIVVAGVSFVAIETPLAHLMRPREGQPRGAVLTAS
jgi:peptidoglycan/LPS O-acetylase OafA/YrhL